MRQSPLIIFVGLTLLFASACSEEPAANEAGMGGQQGAGMPSSVIPTTPGAHPLQIEMDGTVRDFILDIPAGYDGQTPMPLVVFVHGSSQTGNSFINKRHDRLFDRADAEGWLMVFPTGLEDDRGKTTWNNNTDPANSDGPDDVGFLLAMLDALEANLQIADGRVFIAGFSAGGVMTQHLVSLHPGRFGAMAAVATGIGGVCKEQTDTICYVADTTGPIPALLVLGTNDPSFPIDGRDGDEGPKPSLDEMVSKWLAANSCTGDPVQTEDEVRTDSYTMCTGDTQVRVVITSMAHIWPDSAAEGWDANNGVLDFFAQY